MNADYFALPIAPLILFGSIVVSLTAGWLYSRRRVSVDGPVFNSVIFGLVIARISFVLQYLPAYRRDVYTIFDFRDQGFNLIAGAVAGGCVTVWYIVRRSPLRGPLLVAIAAGVTVWSTASAVVSISREPQRVPPISLLNINGVREPLAQTDGRPTVLNLWATWCPPCQAEMPILADAQANRQDINIVFVNQGQTHDVVLNYLNSHDLPVKHALLDPGLAVSREASVSGYPTTLFYDAKGNLLAEHMGPFSRATFADSISRLYPEAERRFTHSK